MTVAQLKKLLENVDDEMPIVMLSCDNRYSDLSVIEQLYDVEFTNNNGEVVKFYDEALYLGES